MKYLRSYTLFEHDEIGEVYFNDDDYPGYMYVNQILPIYQMYWIDMSSNQKTPALLEKDLDMDVYWLTSPKGEQFGYELLRQNDYYVLVELDSEKLSKHSMEINCFPSN